MSVTCMATRRVPVPLAPSTYRQGIRLVSGIVAAKPNEQLGSQNTPLARMTTKTLLRSLALTSLMSKSWLLRPSLDALSLISKSKFAVLNPDKNPILNKILRWILYNHFAAGTNATEVARSLGEIRGMGYQGIILGYAKEVVLKDSNATDKITDGTTYTPAHYKVIDEWKDGTLKTLRMIGPGDFLAIKLTGAGPISIDAVRALQPMPKAVEDAMKEICEETRKQGSRLWIDAEQQALQPGLDKWTIDLMQKYNRDGQALVYNTIQAYLKGSQANANRHITLAAKEGWAVGIKLVRGAYIEHEVRSLIHDTKEDTDRSYDAIADMIISQKLPEGAEGLKFPSCALFLATHNAASAEKAIATYRQRSIAGLPTATLECGQIQGMADELSCTLLENHENSAHNHVGSKAPPPGVFKYQTWGSVAECMGYLYRRAVENRRAVERTQHTVTALKQELRRRLLG